MSPRTGIVAGSLALACLFGAGGSWAQEPAEPAEALEAAQGSPTAEELARELLELTGGIELGQQVITQMVDSFRGMDASVPDEFWDEFLAGVDPEEFENLVVPIYVRHLTVEEMSAAIEFFSSPAGRSLVGKQQAIAAESMAAGQAWGEEIARKAIERLERFRQEGPES